MPDERNQHSGLSEIDFNAIVNAVTSRFDCDRSSGRGLVDRTGCHAEIESVLAGLFEQVEAYERFEDNVRDVMDFMPHDGHYEALNAALGSIRTPNPAKSLCDMTHPGEPCPAVVQSAAGETPDAAGGNSGRSALTWNDVLEVHYQTGDYVSLGIWAQDNVPGLVEQLEASQAALAAFFAEWDGDVGTYAPTDDTLVLMRAAYEETK